MHPELQKTIDGIKTSNREIFFQILLVFIVPVGLIAAGVLPIEHRVSILSLAFIGLAAVLFFFDGWTLRMFGLHLKETKRYARAYFAFTIIMILIVVLFSEQVLHLEEIQRWWTHRHFIYLFFIVSLVQEVAYRGYLMPALGKLSKNIPMVLFANALIFTFLHIIFPNPMIGLPLAFTGGMGFAIMYLYYPSLPLVVLSHAALNFCVVLYGFFVIPGATY
jgi:membrane protease YdiL (CAAX protease family)